MTRTLRHVLEEVCKGSEHTAFDGGEISAWWPRVAKWPPDVFAVTSILLSDSGAYTLIVSPPNDSFPPSADREAWLARIRTAAKEWRAWLADTSREMPADLQRIGNELGRHADVAVESLRQASDTALAVLLLELHAMADSACVWLGIPDKDLIPDHGDDFSAIRLGAELRLALHGTLASFPPDKFRVLPKMRTPQLGISLRSLSFHLAMVRTEVRVDWSVFPGGMDQLAGRPEGVSFNLLLFPWPFDLAARAFKEQPKPRWAPVGDSGTFEYEPPRSAGAASVAEEVAAALDAARSKHVIVDAIVIPEAAIDDTEFWEIAAVLQKHDVRILLAGVRGKTTDERYSTNVARLGLLFKGDSLGWHVYEQRKHHRWCIDSGQIYQYHLGAALSPRRPLWENIDVPQRTLHFVALNSWLTLSHLICEDLARIDPVSEVLRAVGPNLLIALLLDGPQLEQRWPGRYASIFADDPGSSVLTLTSLGMVRRSNVKGHLPSRVIGLWKDRIRGTHELSLDEGSRALVLALCGGFVTEFTADGRDDEGAAGQLVLGAVEQISWTSPPGSTQGSVARRSPICQQDLTVLCIVTDALALAPDAHNEILELAEQFLPKDRSSALRCLRNAFRRQLRQRNGRGNRAILKRIKDQLGRSKSAGSDHAHRALRWTLHGRLGGAAHTDPPPAGH